MACPELPAADFTHTVEGGEVTITGYTGAGGSISIPAEIDGSPVTRIGERAFLHRSSVTAVELPSGIEVIDDGAFLGCTNIASINFPTSVTTIGDGTFNRCQSLTGVVLNEGLQTIGDSAFADATALTGITFPVSVTHIGTGAFRGAAALADISVPASVTQVGSGAFANCTALTSATVLGGLTANSTYLFEGCTALAHATLAQGEGVPAYIFQDCGKLVSVALPPSATSIGAGAFKDCALLGTISLPAGVVSIGSYAFETCASLSDVTFPAGVQSVGYRAFAGCSQLRTADFQPGLLSIGQSAFIGSGLESVSLPEGLTQIDSSAFGWCASLVEVNIPASVTNIGIEVFARCTSLARITVDGANPGYQSVDGVLFDLPMTMLITYPAAREGPYAVPNGVTSIGPTAFGSAKLSAVVLPSSLETVGSNAFSHCPHLENVSIPASVTYLGVNAFAYSDSLSAVMFEGDAPGTGNGPFDWTADGFTVFYHPAADGFTSPTWKGYPAVALAGSQRIQVKGPFGQTLGNGGAAIDFGYLLPGASASRSFTVANSGSTVLGGLSVGLSGSAAADFSIDGPSVTSLAPGTSATFTVTFTAGAGGSRSATLRFVSDDPADGAIDVPLVGVCTPTPRPEIVVTQYGPELANEGVVDAGTTSVGTFVVTGVTIYNPGTEVLQNLAVTLDGTNAGDFKITSAVPSSIAAGGFASVIVRFAPEAIGERSARLHISSNDADEGLIHLTLRGTALPPPSPEIAVEDPAGTDLVSGESIVTFDAAIAYSGSNWQTFTLINRGNAYLSNLSITKSGPNAADFLVGSLSKNHLIIGESITFVVTFRPSAVGSKNASLQIWSNDADENPFEIQLTGVGIAQPSAPEIAVKLGTSFLTDDGSGRSFASVPLGGAVTYTFSIINQGTADLGGLALSVDGAHASDFTLGSLTTDVLAPKASTDFTVTFQPGEIGERTAALRIASDDSDENPFDIPLWGYGTPALEPEIVVGLPSGAALASGDGVSFGEALTGASVRKEFVIRNTGDAALAVGSITTSGRNATAFTISEPQAKSLAPGTSSGFAVTFQPGKAGPCEATLHLASDDPDVGVFELRLAGKGIEREPKIVVREQGGKTRKNGKGVVSFGSVKMKSGSVRKFVIRNTGTGVLENIKVKTKGAAARDFRVKSLGTSSLAPGASVTFKVTFKPKAEGKRKASLRIVNNDAADSPFVIDLVGKGVVSSSSRAPARPLPR
ncbi:MAG: leucine-rich repeat protein [Akkermansiaceae bacterium]|nr:leucine-rich repeat protein [Akkermansiaceae bacterium]MCP5542706.1 leucine-rich repeat protein [Akkermansiaceae bacterium]MCP5548664.1 leucine-rich repeat protein [Akkermansiaceae bacterium]